MSYVGAAVLILLCGALLVRPLRAQIISGNLATTQQTKAQSCSDKVQVTGLTISPQQPSAGQAVTVTLTFTNACTSGDARNIPWAIAKNNVMLGEGTSNAVAPGQTVTVSRTWIAQLGPHDFYAYVDPMNTFVESSTYRANNISGTISVTVNGDWTGVRDKTKTAVSQMVNTWRAGAMLGGVAINGPTASGGRIAPMPLGPILFQQMVNAGMQVEIASPMSKALSDQWMKWAGSVQVPGMSWYPPFAAFPGPLAPLTPNPPTPLAVLTQDRSIMSVANLTEHMNRELGAHASLPGASAAVSDIANWMNGCFNVFVSNVMVTNVMGTGPVPTFAPPYVPVGPVVGGVGTQVPGGMIGSWCP